MGKRFIVLSVVVVLLGVLVQKSIKICTTTYNNIVSSEQKVKKSVGDLESEYQRRYALVGNLVKIVKQTKDFEEQLIGIEKEIYVKTAEAKASATKMDIKMPGNIKKRIKEESSFGDMLTNAMDKLMVQAQKFPNIKDPKIKDRHETFDSLYKLRQELKDIEENILYVRKCLNEYIRVYNANIVVFPANLIANHFGFDQIPYFTILNEGAKNDVEISF